MKFGEVLRELLEDNDITQKQLAQNQELYLTAALSNLPLFPWKR